MQRRKFMVWIFKFHHIHIILSCAGVSATQFTNKYEGYGFTFKIIIITVMQAGTLISTYVLLACLSSTYMCFDKNPLVTHTVSKQG